MSNITGKLKTGLTLGKGENAIVHKEFEVREGAMSDYFAAENMASINQSLSFDAALLCQRVVNIGSFNGPFTMEIFGRLKPADFAQLRKAMWDADNAGESAPEQQKTD